MQLPVRLSATTLIAIALSYIIVSNTTAISEAQGSSELQIGGGPADQVSNQTAAAAVAQEDRKRRFARNQKEAQRNGKRRHIRVVTLEVPPFMMKRRELDLKQRQDMTMEIKLKPEVAIATNSNSNSNNNNNTASSLWYGYCMDFFLELIKHLPYEVSFEIYEAKDGKFGSNQRDIIAEEKPPPPPRDGASGGGGGKPQVEFKRIESWNGIVGELQQGKADLALAPLAVMAERELEIDFTVPFYDLVGVQILLKRPEMAQNWFKFLTVLDNDVWLSIGLAYFVTSFIIYLFDRLSPYSHKNLTRIKRVRARQRASDLKLSSGQGHPMQTIFSRPHTNKVGQLGGGGGGGQKFYLSRPLTEASAGTGAGAGISQKLQTISGGGGELDYRHLGTLSGSAPSIGPRPPPQLVTNSSNDHELRPPIGDGNKRRRLSQEYLANLQAHLEPASVLRNKLTKANAAQQAGDLAEEEEMEEDEDNLTSDELDGKPEFNLRDSLWFCITSLTPQGGGEAPQNLSGRVVAGAWWLFCFIVIASYTANLAAFLTVSRLDIPIESLDDLAKQYRIKYAPIDGTAEQTYFERMAYIEEIFYNIWKEMSLNASLSERERSKFSVWDYPISDKYTKIWSQIQEVGMPITIESALKRVKSSTLDDGFALLADANLIKWAVMTDCNLKAVGDEFSRKPIALGLAKGQEKLRDDISYAILQLINKRFMEILREKWWTNNPARLTCNSNDESEGISVENIGGVFIIILAGVLLSFLAWALERFAYNTRVEMSRNLLDKQLASGLTQTLSASQQPLSTHSTG